MIFSAKVADWMPFDQFLPTGRIHDWLKGLILLGLTILVYQPVWYAGFIWDDAAHVTANPCIVGPLGLKEIWTTQAASICPLTLTTFWVEHALWGLEPFPYHLVNILQEGTCAILLWQVLRILQMAGAWLGAALWALHPLQVESVAWISEMKNTQSCLFYLLAILFFVNCLKACDRNKAGESRRAYALTLLFSALAMASKSSTVVLPMVLFLCAWWMEGRWNWRNLMRLGPIFAISFLAGVVTLWPQMGDKAVMAGPSEDGNWPERVARAGDVIWFYLGKLTWPRPLMAVYPRWQVHAEKWTSYLPLLAAILVLFILWLNRHSWSRSYFFAFTYFLVVLFPFLGLIDQSFWRFSFVEDHLQYLAGMGPLALAGAGLTRLSNLVAATKRWVPSSLCAGLLLLLGVWSWQRNWVYENETTFWTDALAKNPDCWLGYNNLGVAFVQKGQVGKALVEYRKALETKPDYAEAYKNLGVAFFQMGQPDDAIEQYQRALEFQPNDAEIYNKMAMVFAQKGESDTAIEEYRKALEIRPNYAEAYNNLGIAFFQTGQTDEAIKQYQRALEIDPGDAEAHNNLAVVLVRVGRESEAIGHYQRAVEIKPDYAAAYKNLGIVLSQMGQLDEAIQQYQKALKINPDYAEAYNNLGIAFFKKGKIDQAIALFKEALRCNPNYRNAQDDLAKAQAVTSQNPSPK
jgi:protein O-mannosyl-transferase